MKMVKLFPLYVELQKSSRRVSLRSVSEFSSISLAFNVQIIEKNKVIHCLQSIISVHLRLW